MKKFIRFTAIVWCGLTAMLTVAPARAQEATFGRETIGATPSGGMQADFKRGSKFTLTADGMIEQLCAYLSGGGGGSSPSSSQDYQFAMYRDDHGVPGAKVVETGQTNNYAGIGPEWHCLGTPLVPISPGDYWLMIQTGAAPGVLRYYLDGPTGWFGGPDAFVDGPSDPFGSGNSGAGTVSIYAKYTRTYHSAGRSSVAPSRSGGMTANQKRASSFTLTETGLLSQMAAYLDGLGGAAGSQIVQAGLYRDANGSPGELVAGDYSRIIQAGQPGSWSSSWTPEAKLTPGKYWIALLSSGPAGVARYALDGTGNWYGNADAFADGFSNPFGPANPGNGTISAYVTYRPGTFTTGQLGRTDVASTPLKGLTANFVRGSRFEVPDNGTTKLVNALYAYLDGNGGAAGSQTVRMGLYFQSYDDGAIIPVKVAESQVISIPAGTPPGWFRFPVPATSVASGGGRAYWIVIHSGATGGVVRSYGDGAANWHGNDDTFSDGLSDALDYSYPWDGTVTLSVYATYDEFHPGN